MRLSEMLRLYIAANGLEQKAVATEIGINESSFSRFLSGNATPDGQGMIKVIAWISGVDAPKQTELERRLDEVESQIRANAPAIQAAWENVKIGGPSQVYGPIRR